MLDGGVACFVGWLFWSKAVQDAILEKVSKSQTRKVSKFSVGDRVSVYVRLKEGEKERTQIFRGVVIKKSPKSGKGPDASFIVRKVSWGVGVERIFPLHSPFLEKVEVEHTSGVRRSRLYFLRQLKGKKARLKEKGRFEEFILPAEDVTPADKQGTMDAAISPQSAGAPVSEPAQEKKAEKDNPSDTSSEGGGGKSKKPESK